MTRLRVVTGSDTIKGGDGTSDVAVFEYDQKNYTFESSADGQTITITDTINNYVDTVTGVETLKFADGEIEVSQEAGQLVLTGDDTIGDNIEIVGQYPVTVRGRDFDDDIVGGLGNDTLEGGLGNDTLEGGLGNDTLEGGSGSDTIKGGDGSDVAVFEYDQKNYTFESSADGQTITITNTINNYVDTVTGVETLKFADGEIEVSQEAGQLVLMGDDTIGDNIEIVGQYPVTVRGRDFDDDIVGGSGNDTLEGGLGNDTLEGGSGSDTIKGGDGSDVAVFAGDQIDYTFASSSDGRTVMVTDANGHVDTVTDIETLRFDDGDLNGLYGWRVRFPSCPVSGEYGTLTIDALGEWTYKVDNNSSDVQASGCWRHTHRYG